MGASVPLLVLMASLLVMGASTGLILGYVLFAPVQPVYVIEDVRTAPVMAEDIAAAPAAPSIAVEAPAPVEAPAAVEPGDQDDELSLDDFASFSMPSGGGKGLPDALTDEATVRPPTVPPLSIAPPPPASLVDDLTDDAAAAVVKALSQPAGPRIADATTEQSAALFSDLADPSMLAELEVA